MSYLSSLRTPTKRIVRRPLKKPTKQEHEATVEELEAKLNTDNQGVGVIGEVTPDSRSTSGILSVMRANTAERHELGLSSEPNTHFGQGSSNQAEGAQAASVIGYGPREQAIPAGDSDDTPMQLQNPLLSADDQLGAFKEAALLVEGTCSEDTTTLRSAKKLYAKGNDQGLVVKSKVIAKGSEESKEDLLEKDPIGNGLMKRPHETGSSVKTTPISSKKDEIKEEGSSKEAAKMQNRAIDLSDVTKAGAPGFRSKTSTYSSEHKHQPPRIPKRTYLLAISGGCASAPYLLALLNDPTAHIHSRTYLRVFP